MQHNDKNLTWFLDELAEADEGQIKTGEIEVYGEGLQGNDCSCTVYITDLAAAAKARIEALELCLRSAQAKFAELEYYTRVQEIEKLSEEVYATTHENISLYISTNKRWWQFWKPAEITVIVSATVNRDLGVALSPKSINF